MTVTNAKLPLEDEIASTAFWYQQEPHKKFPPLPVTEGPTPR